MSRMRLDLTVILVSYNTELLLRRALLALIDGIGCLNVRIVVVDNASSDGSVAMLRAEFPQCELICNSVNVGFGRANNQALAVAGGGHVLLLNTDAFVAPDTLPKAIGYMNANPRCGILGVKLVGSDGAPQPSARYFPTPWNVFLSRTGLSRIFNRARLVDDADWDLQEVRLCDWVPGCFYLVRREVIEQVGLFDPRYFLYFEEVDHCFVARKAGWEVACFPHASVVHLGGESARTQGAITESGRQIETMQIESELMFFRKNYGLAAALAGSVLSTLADAIAVLKRMLRGSRPFGVAERWRHSVRIWSLLLKTRMGTQPTR